MTLEKLEPQRVWHIFENLFCSTYRASKHEDEIRKKIIDWIENYNHHTREHQQISYFQDEIGNLLIKKPPSDQGEKAEKKEPLLLQGHMDMVTETNRKMGYDFETQSIPLTIEGNKEWITAEGTTLGADNGIGVSITLALLTDPDLAHGPLEVLLTADEETGLTGAFKLDPRELPIESKKMINIDSEDFGVITIGSAGGGGMVFLKDSKQLDKKQLAQIQKSYNEINISVKGLRGGHSGVDIHLPRANAHKITARMLYHGMTRIMGENKKESTNSILYLSRWRGGSKHNAIPRTSDCTVYVHKNQSEQFLERIEQEKDALLEYFSQSNDKGEKLEPNISISIQVSTPQESITSQTNKILHLIKGKESSDIIRTVFLIPHGPIQYSPTIPNLVETSNNLAIIETDKNTGDISIHLSTRSNRDTELTNFRQNLKELGILCGWKVDLRKSYPAWPPDPSSPFLSEIKGIYCRFLDHEVKIEAVHAGLETGVIGEKIPGIQMVSIGPTIQNPHTPDERVHIASVQSFYRVLKAIIEH